MFGKAICFGEVLFDRFGDELKLGGAPLNFAFYLRQFGVEVGMVSAVGRDAMGEQVRSAPRSAGIGDSCVLDRPEPTGVVEVTLTSGQPSYEIREGVAWDHIELPAGAQLSADLLCFGTLAQRTQVSRAALKSLLGQTFRHRVFDVNLRQHYHTPEIILDSLSNATVLKMNDEEMAAILGVAGVTSIGALMSAFGLEVVALTLGENGAELFTGDRHLTARGAPVNVVDAVGAGDAFGAVIAAALIQGAPLDRALQVACDVGAFAVSHRGAQVELPTDLRSALG